MFFHKSKPITIGFACAAAAVMLSFTANPAQADRRSYCDEPECKYPVGGIVQKERDGVNYFYGGSYVATPSLKYIYVIGGNPDRPVDEPVLSSDLYTTSYLVPLSKHRFRMKKDHWKWKKHHPGPLDLPGLNSGDKFMGP